MAQKKKGVWHKSYPGHVLWCAAAGGRGHRARQAAESARRPQGEVAPDRTTTSPSLQSERSNPLPVAPGPHREDGGGGPGRGEPGGQVGPVAASCGQKHGSTVTHPVFLLKDIQLNGAVTPTEEADEDEINTPPGSRR